MRPIIHSKKQNNNGAKFFFIFALLLIVFFSISQNSLRVLSSWLNMAAVPFWNTAGSTTDTLSSTGGLFRGKAELLKENELLKQRVDALVRNLKGYDFAVQENIELKKLLFGKKETSSLAGILAHPGGSLPFDAFLLDIGSAAGVKNGDIVLADKNIAIGKVSETYPYSAKVKGFSSAGEAADVFLGPNNTPIQIKGAGGGAYSAEVPRGLDVQEGDAAVLPGLDGYILAYVESKEGNISDSFQKLYLRSPVNVFELKYVQIIPRASSGNE